MKKHLSFPIYLFIVFYTLSTGCEKNPGTIPIVSPWIHYGSMTDQGRNTYKTILIGTQTWMAENLKTTTLNDGTPIPLITDASEWSGLTSPACCWQNNNPARKVTYGVLYNWYTINTGKLCPAGWHVATDADWTTLVSYLGGENIAGGKLKESGYLHWLLPNTGATDEVAFRALPGGARHAGTTVDFKDLGVRCSWWTTSSNDGQGVSMTLYDDAINIKKHYNPKQYGMSVRCVWDY